MDHDERGWNDGLAQRLDGALLLVGLTHIDPAGPWIEQFFGIVISVDEAEGIMMRLEGNRSGEIYRLPPDLSAFFPARPGSYRLRQTGEVVTDPDFTATWDVMPLLS